jgi:hypothetical protein
LTKIQEETIKLTWTKKKKRKEKGKKRKRAAFEIEFDKKARGTPSSLSTLSHRLSARLNEPI